MTLAAGLTRRLLNRWGIRVSRVPRPAGGTPYSPLFPGREVADLDRLAGLAQNIPGMLSEDTGKLLFALCYLQDLAGDVAEIGSWQGYSTSFLARAVAQSGNGRMYAVDHFKGNVGKQALYRVGRADLSDLQARFGENMRRLGLSDTVQLLALSSRDACEALRGAQARLRFLFIDGDHSRQGVRGDVELFFPLLVKGAIVVFDDCSPSAPGVIEVIDALLDGKTCRKAFSYLNTLVMRL